MDYSVLGNRGCTLTVYLREGLVDAKVFSVYGYDLLGNFSSATPHRWTNSRGLGI